VVRGSSFSHQVTASNSPTSYAATGLPTGLSINTSTGLISGTVSSSVSAAVYSVALTATNAGGTGTQTYALTVTIPLPSAPAITSASSGSAVIGSSFSHQIVASNSPTSYAATGLPTGLSINTSTGLISGTVASSVTAGVKTVTLTATNAGGSGSQTFSLTVTASLPSAPVISSASTASGVTGSSFTYQIVASNSPTSYNATGLPSGLNINTSSGQIYGTISSSVAPGVYSITLSAYNAGGTGTKTLSLTLTAPLPSAPVITSASSASAVIGSSFSHQIVATNSPTSYAATGLPSGLSINTSTGLISGTVSSSLIAGVYSVNLTATNAGGSGTKTFSLTLTNPLPSAPVITSAASGSAVIGSAFSHQVVASNSPTSYAASGLPSGLSINSSTGLISGTVASSVTAGVYPATIVATNAGGSGSQTFSLTLTAPLPSAPVISSAATASTVVGSPFSYQITASNSPTSYAASGLPSGLSINASTGLISGTVPTSVTAGIYSITLTATNAGGSGTKALALTVTVPSLPVPVITSPSSARLVLGVAFNFQVVATNSPTAYTAAGLPTGVTINGTNGLISGTPALTLATGLYAVTVTATNASGSTTQMFGLEVKSAYAAWAQDAQMGDVAAASTADPDGDGISNLLEYAFDLSPSSADTVAVTQARVVNVSGTRRVEITFVRPINRPDLVYTVEVSSNLMTWTAGHAYGANTTNGSGLPTQEMERTSLGADGERIRVRDVGGVGQRFIRVRVTTL
jgi:PKD repeat protein